MPEVLHESITTRTPNSEVTKESTQDSNTQTLSYLIYFIFGVLELLLLFRFILRLTGANPHSGFVSFIYAITQLFIMPFGGIFPVATTQGAETTAIFEPSTLVALVVYSVLAWGIVRLIAILAGKTQEIE